MFPQPLFPRHRKGDSNLLLLLQQLDISGLVLPSSIYKSTLLQIPLQTPPSLRHPLHATRRPPLRGPRDTIHPDLQRVIQSSLKILEQTHSHPTLLLPKYNPQSAKMPSEYRHMSTGSLNIPPPTAANGNGSGGPPPNAAGGMGRFEGPRSPPGRQSK